MLQLLGTRIQLLGVELREETLRAQRIVVFAVVAAFLLGAALVMAGILVVVALWDTHRLLAAGGLAVLYAAMAIALFLRVRDSIRTAPLPFSATAKEIEADLEMLGSTSPEAR